MASDELKEKLAAEAAAKDAAAEAAKIAEANAALEKEKKEKQEAETKANEALARAAKAEAELAFATLTAKTPDAAAHKDEIITKAKEKNLSIDEAAVLVLSTKEKPEAQAPDLSNLGGAAAVRPAPTGQIDPMKMTQAEREKALREEIDKNGLEMFKNLNING